MKDRRLLSDDDLAVYREASRGPGDGCWGNDTMRGLLAHIDAQRTRIKALAHENETLRAALVVEGVA